MQGLDEKGFYDIYSIWHVPFWQTRTFYLSSMLLVLTLLLVFAWFFIQWYRRKMATPLTAWEIALNHINQLQAKNYQTKESGKQCYFIMTNVVKTYLISRYHYPLRGKTDEEMITYLEKNVHQRFIADNVKKLINGCEYIKFANESAMQEQIIEHLSLCDAMIRKTIPQEKRNPRAD